ncbi:MAG: hypothetical protein ACYCXB_05490 [Candidatus Humimicrobiaceae bacterium]
MPKCTIDNLESSFLPIQEILLNCKILFIETLESKFKKIISEFNSDAITYCLEKYIGVELDYKTQGSRGIGRMTTIIPRFGAYFRESLKKLSSQELNELYLIIQDLCLRGYLAHVFLVEESVSSAKLSKGDPIYKAWIPCIYVSDPFGMGPKLITFIGDCTESAFRAIYDFMRQHGIKSGVLFNKIGSFLSEDTISQIFTYYVLAGISLRHVEVRGK